MIRCLLRYVFGHLHPTKALLAVMQGVCDISIYFDVFFAANSRQYLEPSDESLANKSYRKSAHK